MSVLRHNKLFKLGSSHSCYGDKKSENGGKNGENY